MPGATSRQLLRDLSTLFHGGTAGQFSDEQLLDRFVAGRDEVAEAAFAALVERHGAMVLGVCRRVLGNRDEAEDAFQATFLVLARKARTIARRGHLFGWLYGVALRAALDARARASRRKAREKRLGAMLPVEPPDQADTSELRVILDEELARLPERYRSAVILCELEGLTRREAAGRLGVSEGTLSSRLARAKVRLKDRLTRRGVALSAPSLASFLAREAQAVIVPPALLESTIRVAALAAAGSSTAGVVSASVATIAEGVLKAMLLAKFKGIALGLVTLTLVTTGLTAMAQRGGQEGFGGGSPDDRMKAVEQKLDKLLEVLGGSGRAATPSPAPMPASTPAPAAAAPGIPAPAAPAARGGPFDLDRPGPPSPAPLPNPPSDPARAAPPAARGGPAALGPSPAAPPSTNVFGSDGSPGGPAAGGSRIPRVSPTGLGEAHARLDSVERRLDDLERRLDGIERRLNRSNSVPSNSPNPSAIPPTLPANRSNPLPSLPPSPSTTPPTLPEVQTSP